MLEVLIAVLVFSLGMIGLAGLLIFSIQSNHVAYLRTQATFLAHNMAARMGANPAAVWAGDYNKTFPVTGTAVSCATGCTPANLATYDMQQWSTQLTTFLPNVTGSISCSNNGLNYVPDAAQMNMRPPYGGTCTMQLTWNEAGAAGGATVATTDATQQGEKPNSFVWVFQP